MNASSRNAGYCNAHVGTGAFARLAKRSEATRAESSPERISGNLNSHLGF